MGPAEMAQNVEDGATSEEMWEAGWDLGEPGAEAQSVQ